MRSKRRLVVSALVMAIATGLVATAVPPAIANPSADGTAPTAVPPAIANPSADGAAPTASAPDGEQQFQAAADLAMATVKRDQFEATSSAVLLRRAYAKSFSSYDGPSAEDYLKNPAHPAFSLDAVYNTGLQYLGTPYVFGGANPSGFDCSGFIMFVYAQYGIALPHSVHQQDAIGQTISPQDAQPGDVVIFNDESHDGFYAGNGMILHAPYPGARVRVQPLWTTNVHFVRFGI